MAFCQYCGSSLGDSVVNFCPNCGAAVGATNANTNTNTNANTYTYQTQTYTDSSQQVSDTAKTVLTAAGTAAGVSLLGNLLLGGARRYPVQRHRDIFSGRINPLPPMMMGGRPPMGGPHGPHGGGMGGGPRR